MAGLPQALFDATEAQKAAAKAEERAANASVIGAKAAQLQRELHVGLRDRRGSFGNRVRVFCLLRILPFDLTRGSATKLLSEGEARRIASNIAKLPELLRNRA